MTTHYSREFKKNAVEKLLLNPSRSLCQVAEELRVHASTLTRWKEYYATIDGMKKPIANSKKTNEMKLEAIIKSVTLPEEEFGIFLRENGFHSSDIDRFKQELTSPSKEKKRPSEASEVEQLRCDLLETKKDLKCKNQAIAELAARVMLLKKSHEIWGMPEDDK